MDSTFVDTDDVLISISIDVPEQARIVAIPPLIDAEVIEHLVSRRRDQLLTRRRQIFFAAGRNGACRKQCGRHEPESTYDILESTHRNFSSNPRTPRSRCYDQQQLACRPHRLL